MVNDRPQFTCLYDHGINSLWPTSGKDLQVRILIYMPNERLQTKTIRCRAGAGTHLYDCVAPTMGRMKQRSALACMARDMPLVSLPGNQQGGTQGLVNTVNYKHNILVRSTARGNKWAALYGAFCIENQDGNAAHFFPRAVLQYIFVPNCRFWVPLANLSVMPQCNVRQWEGAGQTHQRQMRRGDCRQGRGARARGAGRRATGGSPIWHTPPPGDQGMDCLVKLTEHCCLLAHTV
jgi:hypothetical protein